MSCESDNMGICVFLVNLFLEFESSEERTSDHVYQGKK